MATQQPVPQPARLPTGCQVAQACPAFLITIDTEGDNLWARPREITVRNAAYLPRFQELCERYGFKPTYVTNWEMANAPQFQEFGGDLVGRGTGEIGMHLHAWNSPPLTPLTDDDFTHLPYLMEYPEPLIREKVRVMTDKLEEVFGVKMHSHRAGRWGLDETYAGVLIEAGYAVDCSVTPHISWRSNLGDPSGAGGPDYTAFPESAYFLHNRNVARAGNSGLLEVPMTVISREGSALTSAARRLLEHVPFGRRVAGRFLPRHWWLRPNGRNRKQLLTILSIARAQGRDYVEFMLHSSEFMPGGSPTFRTAASIDALYDDLEEVFSTAHRHWAGCTLQEYYDRFHSQRSDGTTGGTG